MKIREIKENKQKQMVASLVLRDLPEWFGIEEATSEYINQVMNHPFIAVFQKEEPVGFYSLREENKKVLDMYVLGVLKKYHNTGVGTQLQQYVNEYAKNKGYKYLMVLTLAEKKQNKEYLQTRKFYLKMGFEDFYQSDDIFDKNNPCQVMIKTL